MAKEKKWKSSTMVAIFHDQVAANNQKRNGCLKLRAFLKKSNEGCYAKKSRIFSKEPFETFLFETQDDLHLGLKIVLLIGITGACRYDEMVKMKTTDIEDMGNVVLIKIPDRKTRKVRSFTIIGENYIKIDRKYAALRPKDMLETRFFSKYQNGKCCRSVMGIHTISSVPGKVATLLKLSNSKEYTGHSLRRTSATLLIDGGGNIESLKRHGGWKSSSVAEGYIEEPLRNKNDNASKIEGKKL
ncbi:uncharacterized protein LOC116158558 isoform X1 [Photinus pyralis]|uniref:uncharacterized protein LOC116158558 isoform X1 n=1 Tax=Photinus pyralis TaxID=7054 RepID=UPI0012674285|nr:uncharacterized protein LOC116158558 isoform X1 [Photinus pyralis]XP_031327211.1 uncharacterized protein LOC116158558 isoform X1 [Photinus pyralis]XP_031327212.1 uncharacterized protein LOC116158558 isoform X1 [Photinus pyralis]